MDLAALKDSGVFVFDLSEYGRLKVVGSTSNVTECFCCGKQNLKKTAVMQDSHGNYSFFGTSCAHNASHRWATSTKRNSNFQVPTEITIAGRRNRIDSQAQVEYFNPESQSWQSIHVRGLFALILDNLATINQVENINEVVGIIESQTSLRIPF
jgi:hypothetical protein